MGCLFLFHCMATFSLSQYERIKSHTAAAQLFRAPSQVILVHPLRIALVHTSITESNSGFKVLFTAPKRKYPKAHDRNRIKRLMREAYRLNKPALLSFRNTKGDVHVMMTYIGAMPPSLVTIEKAWLKCLQKIQPTTEA